VRRVLNPNKEVIFETALAAISADELGGSRYIFAGPGGVEGGPGPDYLAYNSHDKANRCTKIKIFYFICWFYNVNCWLMHGYE
jgi:hypothetical protein